MGAMLVLQGKSGLGIGRGHRVWIIFQWNYIDWYILTALKTVWEVPKVIAVEKLDGLYRQPVLGFVGGEYLTT